MASKGTIGVKTKVDGSAEFKKEISACNTVMRTLKSQLELVKSQYDSNDKSVENITAQSKVYNQIADEQRKKIDILKDALKKSTEQYGENDKRTQEWQQKLNKTQSELNNTQRKLSELNEELEEEQKESDDSTENTVKLRKALVKLGLAADDTADDALDLGDVLKANLASEAIIAGVKKLVNGLKNVSSEAIEVGSSFEKSMSQVAATMGMTSEEINNGSEDFEALKEVAKELGASTQYSATQAAEALNYEALAGYDVEEAIETLPSILNLAASGNMDLATASDQVTDAMSALGLQTEEASEFVDKMAKTSQKSNTSVQQLGDAILTVGGTAKDLSGGVTELDTALGILANNGIKGAEGGTQLRNIILALTPTTAKATKAWNKLGISAYDANGKLRPINETFKDLNEKLSVMTQEDRTNVLTELFNKQDLKGVNALLSQCGNEFSTLSDNIANSEGCAAEMAYTLNDNLKGRLDELSSAAEGLGITVYDIFSDTLKNGVENATESITELDNSIMSGGLHDSFETLSDSVGHAVDKAINFGSKALPVVIDGLSWVLNNIDIIIAGLNGLATAMVAKKGYEIIKKGVDTYKAMQIVVKSLTLQTAAQTVATEGATVAQEGLNVAMSSNAIGLVISAVGALVGILGTFILSADNSKDSTNEFTEEVNRLKESAIDAEEKVGELSRSFDQSVSDVEAQAGKTQILTDKLYELAEVENKSNAQKQEMTTLVASLNEQIPNLNLSIDEQTGALSRQKEQVYALINANKEQYIAQAYQETYTKIAQEQATAQQNLYEAEKKRADIESELAQAEKELAEQREKTNQIDRDCRTLNTEVVNATRERAERVDSLQKSLKDCDAVIKSSNETIQKCGEKWDDTSNSIEQATENVETSNEDIAISTSQMSEELQSALDEAKIAYQEAFESARDSINKTIGLFDEVADAPKKSAAELQKNLDDQVKQIEEYRSNIQSLSSRVSEEFIAEIKELGIGSASEIATLASMSDEELKKYEDTWKKKQEAVNETAEELTEEKAETINTIEKQIAENTKTNAQTMADNSIVPFNGIYEKMQAVGENYGQGFVDGINSKKLFVQNSANDLGNIAYQATKNTLDIHSPSKKGIALGENYAQSLGTGIKNKKEYAKASAADVSKAILSEAKQHLSNYKVYNNVSLQDEIDYWDAIRKQCTEGTQARVDADKAYFDAKKELSEEEEKQRKEEIQKEQEKVDSILSDAKKELENRKVYNEVSYKDEMDYWNKVRKEFKKGTQNRIDADKLYLDAKKNYENELEEINQNEIAAEQEKAEKIAEINESYREKVNSAVDDMKSSIESLKESYSDAVTSRASNIVSGLSLFDAYEDKTDPYLSGALLQQNLTSQVRALEDWSSNLDNLRSKGVDSDFVDAIEDMGIEANGELKAINSMTDEELDEYVRTWKYKNQLAKDESTKQLSELKDTTDEKVNEIINNTNGILAQAYKDYVDDLEETQGTIYAKLAAYTEMYRSTGIGYANALIAGFKGIDIAGALSTIANEQKGTSTIGPTLQNFSSNQGNSLGAAGIASSAISSLKNVFVEGISEGMKNIGINLDGDKIGNIVDSRIINNM